MTILAETNAYLAEYDQHAGHRLLSITERCTGMSKTLHGPRIASDFRDCLKTHSAERTIATWLRIMHNQPWEPCYKPMILAYQRLSAEQKSSSPQPTDH